MHVKMNHTIAVQLQQRVKLQRKIVHRASQLLVVIVMIGDVVAMEILQEGPEAVQVHVVAEGDGHRC